MKRLSLLVLIVVIQYCVPAFAQTGSLEKDIVYGHLDGMALVYDVETPENANGLGIIAVVSGGWHSGPENSAMNRPFLDVLLTEGYTLFHLYHPSMPTYRVPDAYRAARSGVTHILEHAGSFGVDPARLGITGVSSGGHLALLLGMHHEGSATRERRPAAVVAFMPPADLRGLVGNVRATPALGFDPSLAPQLSPVDHVSADDPPVLLIHGESDTVVPYEENGVRLAALLRSAGVTGELVTVKAGHEVFPAGEMAKAHAAMIGWFSTHL